MQIEKDGHTIATLAEWQAYAGPKRPEQWQPHRSAYELARAWCGRGTPAMPAAVRALLDSRVQTRGTTTTTAWPEMPIRFDKRLGEPRNADLAFVGTTPGGEKVAVTIEAKADESFGATVAETFADALERYTETPRSQGIGRIEDLARALFTTRDDDHAPKLSVLRYQLLTASAGTLALANRHGATHAVLVIHEFVTNATRSELHDRNAQDFAAFLHRLRGVPVPAAELAAGSLVGPFRVPGLPLFDGGRDLLIGKIVSDVRRPAGED